ncbi:MAG: GNAT family N-acetyltransferase [Firmicutes bacterium]|nr:GNAT family N-acetyltransferase [Bacillota bacterium]
MIDKIIPLDRERWQGHVLEFRYTAHNYYDVEITQGPGGFNVSFVKKPFDTPYVANSKDKLFQHWNEDIKAWGIVEGDKLVAVIETAIEEWCNRLWVTELWIDDAYHRMGIGTALMDIAVKRAKDENRRAVVLETQTCNEVAIDFYLAYGLSLTGFDACCYGNSDVQKKEVRIEFGLLLDEQPQKIFTPCYQGVGESEIAELTMHEHICKNAIKDKISRGEIYGAYDGDKLIGWLRYSLFWDMVPFMNMLQIFPEYRGKGVGRQLVEFWEGEMKARGHKQVMTSTQQNEDAQHFYNKLGYVAVGGFAQALSALTEESYELILMKELG